MSSDRGGEPSPSAEIAEVGPDVVRTAQLGEQSACFPETALVGFKVRNRFLVGPGEGPTAPAAFDAGLYVELLTCPSGETLGEHRHPHTEALFVLDGTWRLTWRGPQADVSTNGLDDDALAGDEHDGGTVTLHAWDLVRVPAGIWLSATHDGPDDAHLLVLAGSLGDSEFGSCELAPWIAALVKKSAGRP